MKDFFFVMVEVIHQSFWHIYKWKSLANHVTSDQNIVIYNKPYMFFTGPFIP